MYRENRRWFRKGLHDGIPMGLGYMAVSFTLGIAARNAGLTPWQATLMSLLNNTSAGEFAALSMMRAGTTYLEIALTQAIINLRYLLMSCALSQKLAPGTTLAQRFLLGFEVTDEVFGLSVGVPGKLNPWYSFGLMCLAIPAWSAGTLLGIVSGSVLPAAVLSALSVALYAMFMAVVIPPARQSRVLAGVIATAMSVSFVFSKVPFFSGMTPGLKIILLTVLIAGGAAILFPVRDADPHTASEEEYVHAA